MTTTLATNETRVEQPQELAPQADNANVDQMLATCGGDVNALAQLFGQLQGRQRDAAIAGAHQRFGNAFVAQAMQLAETSGGDDDVIKVDAGISITPAQRAADLLARLTAADAKIARSEVARLKRFRPKIEAEYKQFCLAYGHEDSKSTRLQFVQYLESANLGAKPKAVSAEQQASGAMNVLFSEAKPGERLSPTAIGLREALDPRTALTDDQREKLKAILLEDGRTALQARLEAEQLWQEKKINLVIDVNAAYASGNPHLAAFTSAARDAGYTPQEIEMVTAGAKAEDLWSPVGGKGAMPATLAEFKNKYPGGSQRGFLLDASRLEDARAAVAQGMSLAELDAARKQQGYDPSFRSQMSNESVTTVVDAYIPAEMRPVVGPLLTRLCSPDQAQRNAASKELQALINDSNRFGPENAKALRAAIDGLQAQFGMKNDPMLQLLRVQLDLEANPPGALQLTDLTPKPVDPWNPTADTRTENQKRSSQMREKAEKQIAQIRDQLRDRQQAGSLPREEAARLYEMMATLYGGYVGDAEQAEHCLMMARMYRSDPDEREDATRRMETKNPLDREVLIPRRAPDEPTSVRGITEDERELVELEEQDKEMLAEVQGEYNRKTADFPSGQPAAAQSQKANTERNDANRERAEGAAGILYLVKLALEWYVVGKRMEQLATRRERKEQLEEKIKRETTVRVPPDPAKIREAIQWLVANKHPKLADRMRLVLDAALAFYDKR